MDGLSQARLIGQLFGVVLWAAVAAGGAALSAAGAPDLVVMAWALLAVVGFVVLGVRSTRER